MFPTYMYSTTSALSELMISAKYITDYRTYAEWILSKNRYGKHGKRKVN